MLSADFAVRSVSSLARMSLLPSAMTTIQSFSTAMVLTTVARLAKAPRSMTRAVRRMKR